MIFSSYAAYDDEALAAMASPGLVAKPLALGKQFRSAAFWCGWTSWAR